jgi:endoplasmic reticulum-Golgi intermediate compartment protein 3
MAGGGSMLRGLDAFVRPTADVRNPSVSGGLITVIATVASIVLILSSFIVSTVERHDGLTMSSSQHVPLIPLPDSSGSSSNKKNNMMAAAAAQHSVGRLPLDFAITFPYLSCDQIDVSLDGASYKSGDLAKSYGGGSIYVNFRQASPAELRKAMAGAGTTTLVHHNNKGCTATGKLRPIIVAGIFAVGFHRQSWTDVTTTLSLGMWGGAGLVPDVGSKYNVTHYIHHLEFGTSSSTNENPLRNVLHAVNNDFHGLGIAYTQVKLVPTVQDGTFGRQKTHQASVVDVTIQPQSMAGSTNYPGLVVTYDFTPLTIVVKDRDEDRGNILLVLSSLVGILGGVFVTVQLLTGCLVHSAQEIAKKID